MQLRIEPVLVVEVDTECRTLASTLVRIQRLSRIPLVVRRLRRVFTLELTNERRAVLQENLRRFPRPL